MAPTAGPLVASPGQRLPLSAGAGAGPGPGAAGEAQARVSVRRGARLRALGEGSVALLGASVLLMVVLCAWLLAAEVRLRRRRDRWRPQPAPRSGARPSRVLLLAADADDGYVLPRSLPTPTATTPPPATGLPRAHSYLLVVGGDPAGAATPAYEEVDGVHLRPKAPGAEEGYVPMQQQRRRVPTVLRVVRGGARGGELALELGAAGDEYLIMKPQEPPAPHREGRPAYASMVTPAARPLPPLPSPAQRTEHSRGPT